MNRSTEALMQVIGKVREGKEEKLGSDPTATWELLLIPPIHQYQWKSGFSGKVQPERLIITLAA